MLEMLRVLEDVYENKLGGERICDHYEALQEGFRPKKYQPLMSRTKCSKFSLSHVMGILNGKSKCISVYFEQIASRIVLNTMQKNVVSNYDPMTKLLSKQSKNEFFFFDHIENKTIY